MKDTYKLTCVLLALLMLVGTAVAFPANPFHRDDGVPNTQI